MKLTAVFIALIVMGFSAFPFPGDQGKSPGQLPGNCHNCPSEKAAADPCTHSNEKKNPTGDACQGGVCNPFFICWLYPGLISPFTGSVPARKAARQNYLYGSENLYSVFCKDCWHPPRNC